MKNDEQIELFLLKCAALKLAIDQAIPSPASPELTNLTSRSSANIFIDQFSTEVRNNAINMAEYYKIFYMLENDIRRLIDDTLIETFGPTWWAEHAPVSAKEEFRQNRQREQEAGFSSRSENELDYVSFGQLGEIIRHNYSLFGGIFKQSKGPWPRNVLT
ncbi:hypothetical protein [Beijerinckia sp. L45]|uniref:hypothetical protein n=1 Tax=Beijerinckia sp. L45 TaxID=1641855 RepID=UPI00131CB08F|nr:hypothetical protein [Beijerinckia sp. L45]